MVGSFGMKVSLIMYQQNKVQKRRMLMFQQAEKMQTQNITTMMYREINIMAMPYIMMAVSNNGKSERTRNKVYNENTHNS